MPGSSRPEFGSSLQDFRQECQRLLNNVFVEIGLAFLVLGSLILLVVETDQAAPDAIDSPEHQPPIGLVIINNVLVLVFTAELVMRMFIEGYAYFDTHGIANLVVTLADFLFTILDLILNGKIPHISILRCFRLVRLLRLHRIIKWFPEVGFMIDGMVSAFRTVLWGIAFIGFILLVWSLLAVQILHPINLEVAAMGTYDGCSRCPHAFGSVWNAFLTFAQTLVFGDSWGTVALPIIEEKWWTLCIFFLAFASVGLAAMNLILASIVDSGAQARENALQARNEKVKQRESEEQKKKASHLLQVCQDLDTDESGMLSREEVLEGFDRNAEFREAVTGMKFTREDVEVLFNVLDKDRSGDVDYNEFLEVMQHTQGEDQQRMMVFMKFAILDMWQHRQIEDRRLEGIIESLSKKVERVLVASDSCSDTRSEAPSLRSVATMRSPSRKPTAQQGSWAPAQLQQRLQQQLQQQQQPVPVLEEQTPVELPVPSQKPPQMKIRRGSAAPDKKAGAATEAAARGTPSRHEADSLQAAAPPPQHPPVKDGANASRQHPPAKEPKAIGNGNGEVHGKLVGDWHPLEAAAARCGTDHADSSVEARLNQELLRVLKMIAHHTEAHTRSLEYLNRAVTDKAPSWQPKDVWSEGLRTEALTLHVQSVFDPPPPPPSSHGARPVLESRVGL